MSKTRLLSFRFAMKLLARVPVLLLITTQDVAAQEVSFSLGSYDVVEGGAVQITVMISSPPSDGIAAVEVSTTDGSATAGEDYTADTRLISWSPGDASDRFYFLPAIDDEEAESTETYTLSFANPIRCSIGEPAVATVNITDNDTSLPTARLDVADAYPNLSGQTYLFAPAGEQFDVTVVIENVETFPTTVDWTADFDPFAGTLVFEDSNPQSLTLTAPSVVPGEVFLGGVALDSPTLRKHGVGARSSQNYGIAGTNVIGCAFCVLMHLLYTTEYALEDCFEPGKSSILGAIRRFATGVSGVIETLQRYRDDILSQTERGQYYVDLYNQLTIEAGVALLRDRTLPHLLLTTMDEWVPAFEALADGNGDQVTITQSMEDKLNEILDRMATNGSPALSMAIQRERTALNVGSIAGQTMSEFQDQVETSTSVKERSWGWVKSRY